MVALVRFLWQPGVRTLHTGCADVQATHAVAIRTTRCLDARSTSPKSSRKNVRWEVMNAMQLGRRALGTEHTVSTQLHRVACEHAPSLICLHPLRSEQRHNVVPAQACTVDGTRA